MIFRFGQRRSSVLRTGKEKKRKLRYDRAEYAMSKGNCRTRDNETSPDHPTRTCFAGPSPKGKNQNFKVSDAPFTEQFASPPPSSWLTVLVRLPFDGM